MVIPNDFPAGQDEILPRIVTRFNDAIQRAPWRDVSTQGLREILPNSEADRSKKRYDVTKRVFEQHAHGQDEQHQVTDQITGDVSIAIEQDPEVDGEQQRLRNVRESTFAPISGEEGEVQSDEDKSNDEDDDEVHEYQPRHSAQLNFEAPPQ